jgi:hypothetical protein
MQGPHGSGKAWKSGKISKINSIPGKIREFYFSEKNQGILKLQKISGKNQGILF